MVLPEGAKLSAIFLRPEIWASGPPRGANLDGDPNPQSPECSAAAMDFSETTTPTILPEASPVPFETGTFPTRHGEAERNKGH